MFGTLTVELEMLHKLHKESVHVHTCFYVIEGCVHVQQKVEKRPTSFSHIFGNNSKCKKPICQL